MMTKDEVDEMMRKINASAEAQWQEMAKDKDRASKSLLAAVYSELKDAQDHGIIKAFVTSSLQSGSTHVAMSGDMTELLAIVADIVADISDSKGETAENFCEALKEATALEIKKRKALH